MAVWISFDIDRLLFNRAQVVKILRKEMNILFSCDEYPPLRTGGIGTATKTVAEGLVKKGHKVFVVSGWPYNHDLPYLSEVNGVTVFRIKYFNNLRKVLSKNTLMCKLIRTSLFRLNVISKIAKYEWHKLNQFIAQLVEEKNIDIIELPDYNVLTQFVINKARLYHPTWNIPVVGRVHGNESFLSYYRNGKLNSLVKENDYDFFMSCFKILSVSRFAANFVHDVLNVGKKIDVIHNPMSNKFIVNPTEINNDRKNEIIFIGKLIKEKGAFNLIKAFNIFSENQTNVVLFFDTSPAIKLWLNNEIILSKNDYVNSIFCRTLKKGKNVFYGEFFTPTAIVSHFACRVSSYNIEKNRKYDNILDSKSSLVNSPSVDFFATDEASYIEKKEYIDCTQLLSDSRWRRYRCCK